MDLEGWAQVEDAARNSFIIEWKRLKGENVYLSLAKEAAGLLRFALIQMDDVTDVQVVSGEIICSDPICPVWELRLGVCTVRSSPRVLTLPAIFKGFRTVQVDYGPKRDAYIATWKFFFREVRGWDEKRILNWASNYIDDL